MNTQTEHGTAPGPAKGNAREPGNTGTLERNMANIDRVIRLVISLVIAGILLSSEMPGFWLIIFGAISAILLLTGIFGSCPLYRLFGISYWQHCGRK